MSRKLSRIWIHFGLWITATVLGTVALLSTASWAYSSLQYDKFYQALPDAVRVELDDLVARGLNNSTRARQIYSQYWHGDVRYSEQLPLFIGLIVCLPLGLTVAFWVSRYVTRPLASIVEVSQRVEQGDFSARAVDYGARGEMAEVVHSVNTMIDSLRHLESERLATAASISHELRTPITVLKARLHALCDGVIRVNEAELQTLLAQTEHLGRLVDDLHTLSMAEANQLALEQERLNLALLVAETVEQMQPQLDTVGMVLELTLARHAEEAAGDIRADPLRMRQIITNLISNAIRHGGSGHWLGVEVSPVLDEHGLALVELSISDAGPGLPKELLAQPFQRFAQAPGKRRRDSSGLGLSIVRVLTQAQGGTVNAGISQRGGARFTLRFARA